VAIEPDEFFDILLISIPNDETMQYDLALYFCHPIPNVLNISNEEEFAI